MPENPDLTGIAGNIYNKIRELGAQLGKAQGLKGLGILIPAVLLAVEEVKLETGTLSGEHKREIASRVLNLLINLPILPEWIEGKILGMAVDWFVAFFNRSFGHSWMAQVKTLLGG